MEFNLTVEQRLYSLQSAESTINNDIYNTLLRAGIDPDSFDESNIDELRVPGLEGEVLRLEKLLASLAVVKEKLLNIKQ